MKKSTIPGPKIIKLRKDLEKMGKIELLGKTLKSAFSL